MQLRLAVAALAIACLAMPTAASSDPWIGSGGEGYSRPGVAVQRGSGRAGVRQPRVSLRGVVAPLAAKTRAIMAACGSKVISAVRYTQIAGSGRLSLHAKGRAVDIAGNPKCIYRMLKGWRGGYSIDYHSVRCRGRPCPHVHVSYGAPEWGLRFRHR